MANSSRLNLDFPSVSHLISRAVSTMTESTLIQTTENNNTTGVKMDTPVSPHGSPRTITHPDQQQYSLKWNDFQSSILSSFRHLRDEEDFVDVTIACDTRSFTAHKVVLSACSPYFRKLLKANPCEHPIVILRDVCASDVENLLRFMYNGEVNISHEAISDFLRTAQLLQVRGLVDCLGPNGGGKSSSPVAAAAAAASALAALSASSNGAGVTPTVNKLPAPVKMSTSTPMSAVAAAAAIAAAASAVNTARNIQQNKSSSSCHEMNFNHPDGGDQQRHNKEHKVSPVSVWTAFVVFFY